MQHFNVSNEQETAALAARLVAGLRPGDLLCLTGDLGAGKTSFARALIRTLCGDETLTVPSPTFTLVQTYEAEELSVAHFDLYRLKSADEVFELGWDELRAGIVLVEWPERLGALLPPDRLDIILSTVPGQPDSRHVRYVPQGEYVLYDK